MRLEPDPLDPVGTGLETCDVNPERRDMMLLSTRLRVWNPDVVVPPSELRCHGRRLMVQSLSASHASLHRSRSPISIIESVESAERERDKPRLALNNITAGVRERAKANRTREAGHLDEIQGAVANTLGVFRNGAAGPRVLRFTLVGFIDWLGLFNVGHGGREAQAPTTDLASVVVCASCKSHSSLKQ